MTWEEYNRLFHKEQLNLVAFKRLMDCDEEVLQLVNSAIAMEREACAKVCDDKHDTWRWDDEADSASGPRDCAAAIRARGQE